MNYYQNRHYYLSYGRMQIGTWFAAKISEYCTELDLVLHMRCSSTVECILIRQILFSHWLPLLSQEMSWPEKKKIGFHPENHIWKSIEFLLVYCLSTFNSLLPEELIKWTIDLHSLCTFIKGTTTLLYVRLIMPVSSERPTAWMGPECISRYNGSATVPGLEHNAKLKG